MKKRILSLILALSMVLSVLPLGAFAEGSSGDLIIGSDGYPVGSNGGKDSCSGNDWEYSNGALYLNLGAFNLSTTEPVKCEIHSFATITGGTFNGKVYNFGTISGGTFQQDVENHGTIKNGTFNGDVTNDTTGKISGGTFASDKKVENKGTIEKGTFEGKVTNSGTIERGTFTGTVINSGTIENGTFASSVTNYGNIDSKGTFNGTVGNGPGGTISNGTFNGTVTNNVGTISGGTFKETVINSNGEITGGTFAGSVTNMYVIYGGVFNGKTGLDRVTGVHSITWDAASPDAKIEKVNGVSANWAPYVVVTKSTPTTAKEVTITADTEIFSLNGKPIGTGDYKSSYPDENDKTTVTFTMPSGNVVLGTGELVMKNGLPDCPNGTKGNGWEYRSDTLILTSGTYDFSSTHPQNTSAGTKPAPAVQCPISIAHAKITDGTFSTTVYNGAGGTISDGTFHGEVGNSGKISGGTFSATVNIYGGGTIFDGTFNGKVGSSGTISGGTFSATVENNTNGTISGGTFAAGLSWNDGSVTGGVFNGKTGLTTKAHQVTVTNGSVSQVNGVDPRNADGTTGTAWDLYAYKGTTVIITADTEIFSLNGYPISGAYNSSYPYTNNKKIVKFTMPYNENVVLSTGELVMAGGYPIGSNNGANNYNGKGWAYSAGNLSDPTDTGTLHLWSGTFDFNFADPTTKITRTDSAVACAIQSSATITGGIFEKKVTNNAGGTIYGGTFKGTVLNGSGVIFGGTFAAGLSEEQGIIFGGVFNGKTGLANDALRVTVTNGSVLKVNGEDPLKVDETTGAVTIETAWNLYSYEGTTVTITADTDIFSLNGKSIGDGNCKSSYDGNKNTVKFTMPGEPVVLNGAITCTDLVMEKGWPEASNEGTISCEGTGWSYDHITKTLTLTDGTFDLSSTEPVKCAIQSSATITGGTFEKKVTNNAGGTISGGTFQDTCSVTNSGTIKNGTFKDVCSVTNNSTIENGTFKNMCRVINGGTIKNGTFKDMCSVENNTNGTISGGTFTYKVENNGIITGGVFNGNANLTGVTGGHNITWDAAYSGAKITEVNGVSADWDPYVVVTENATTNEVIITADTEIFSLNGQPIGDGNCNSSYGSDKKTVTFTMPDKDVVLNEEINYGDLVMENGYPVGSNGGKDPCKGDGWQYIKNDPTNGDMLLLTGSNQTGGLYDFSAIGDGSAVECNVFVGKPTAITGGEFNGKVFNNSGILGGTFNGEVENRAPGTIEKGTFNGAVENNGMIENGAFHDAVKNNGIINGGTFNGAVTGSGTVSGSITGSGTLNGEPITKTPEPEPKPEPKPEPQPEPEPTTYTVTVIGGTIDGKTSVSAKENDTLTVVLDQSEIPDGMTFDLWSISSDKLSGDINVDYRAEAMTFPMPAEDVTIRAQYRSAEIIEDTAPSPLATAATVALGGAAAGVVVWQGVSLGVDLYLTSALPQGVPVPTDRRALALLLWETAGKPEVALPTLYGDVPAEEVELQKATHWAVQNGLMDAADKNDASFFDPDHSVTKMDVFGAWLRLKKLLGTT